MRTSSFVPRAVALALVVAAFATAPQPGAAQAASRERTLFVSAVDDKGEPIEGLGPEAFIVREGGQRREILRVSRATEPIDIALLVDNSAAADDEITFLRESLTKFVATMAADNRIAIIALADRPTIFADYTSDQKRLTDGIGRLFPMGQSGMTLLDGVFETARGLARRDGPRAVIVPVVTDGVEFTNRYSRDIVAELKKAGAALHAVTIGLFPYAEEHGIRERSFLLDAGPRQSGGQRISLLSPNGLDSSLQRLARELKGQYKVVYGRPDSLYASDEMEITSGRPGVTMRGARARGETGVTR